MDLKKLVCSGMHVIFDKKYRTKQLIRFGFYNSMPDEEFIRLKFWANMDYELNLEHPKTYNEKLQWLKLNNRKPEHIIMVDKYKVREYIAQKLGEEYLIPLLGVWENPDDIDFDALPDQFVLKCNHNSGLGMCICDDKSKLNIPKVKRELRKGLKEDYYLTGREWPYKDVPRRIIAEKYMIDSKAMELRDYKFFCFDGEPKFALYASERFSDKGAAFDYFDMEWNHLPLKRPTNRQTEQEVPCPANFEKMKDIARLLAKNEPSVRIDLYDVDGQIYFGEITFFPGSGFCKWEPEGWDEMMGSWSTLPCDRNER